MGIAIAPVVAVMDDLVPTVDRPCSHAVHHAVGVEIGVHVTVLGVDGRCGCASDFSALIPYSSSADAVAIASAEISKIGASRVALPS